MINIFIQARMSSTRFPGKILAPLHNKPLLKHIIERAMRVKNADKVIVLISNETSDDPVAAYLDSIKCYYFRGSLNNVFYRFQAALEIFPCDYFVRLSADSPFIESPLIDYIICQAKHHDYDVINNVMVRTFPKGQSVEMIKTKIFIKVKNKLLTKYEQEHVFPYFYHHSHQYNILTVKSFQDESKLNLCIDTISDLERLKKIKKIYQFNVETSCKVPC